MKNIEKNLKEIVKDLFSNNKIDCFIGYEKGSIPIQTRPYFISSNNDNLQNLINKLVWNSFCSNNLAVFLPKYYEPVQNKKAEDKKPRIGIVAKGCDLRSIVALIKEKQIPRENIVIIGVPCQGMVDKRKVESILSGDEIDEYEESKDAKLQIKTRNGKTLNLKIEEILQDCCIECRYPMPEGTDYLIEGKARKPQGDNYAIIKEFENKSPEERWQIFQKEISKCIRCYACRQACPMCYCKECFAEQTNPKWIGIGSELSDNMIFHLIRIFHQSGRCVECDACYRACPMGVDLRIFTKKIVKDVEDLFGYVPNFSLEETPPLSTFKEDDPESFVTDV